MKKTALSDEEIRKILESPITAASITDIDIEAVVAQWHKERIVRALENVTADPAYALLCVRYMNPKDYDKESNLHNMVQGRIAPRLHLEQLKRMIK